VYHSLNLRRNAMEKYTRKQEIEQFRQAQGDAQ
jgi:hypothetical protein